MSEVDALLGLYGAVDRAVVARAIDPANIAPLLGAYSEDVEGGPATGWYDDQYLPWAQRVIDGMAERGEVAPMVVRSPIVEQLRDDLPHRNLPRLDLPHPDPDLPRDLSPQDAIRQALEAFEEIPADDRRAARRLLAVAVASRGMPQFFGSDGEYRDSARKALTFLRADVDPGYAGQLTTQLHAQLANEFTSMGRWTEVIQGMIAQEVLPQTMSLQSKAPPCTGSLVWDPPGSAGTDDPKAAVVLTAGFDTEPDDHVTFMQVIRYLRPENWTFPGSIWTEMARESKVDAHTWVYQETVSAKSQYGTWVVHTDLEFTFGWNGKNEARVRYKLPAGWPMPDSDVVVDSGTLRVRNLGSTVRVDTTKRVRFSGSFDGPGLAMFMCATGYSSVLEDLVLKIAHTAASKTLPFPVRRPT